MSFTDASFTDVGYTKKAEVAILDPQSIVDLLVIAPEDIAWHLSGGSTNTNPQFSIGSYISATKVTDTTLNNIFDNVMAESSATGYTDYRCLYIRNAHENLTWFAVVVWISQPTDSTDDEVDIGLGTSAVAGGSVEPLLARKTDEPPGVVFSRPTEKFQAVIIGDIGPGEHKAVWIRRSVNKKAHFKDNNSFALRVEGDTIPVNYTPIPANF